MNLWPLLKSIRKREMRTVFAREFKTLSSAYYGPDVSGGEFKNKNLSVVK